MFIGPCFNYINLQAACQHTTSKVYIACIYNTGYITFYIKLSLFPVVVVLEYSETDEQDVDVQ